MRKYWRISDWEAIAMERPRTHGGPDVAALIWDKIEARRAAR
jgi:hypothetical protein